MSGCVCERESEEVNESVRMKGKENRRNSKRMQTSYHAGDKLVLVLAQVEPHGLDLEAHLLAHVTVGGEDLGPLHLGELLHL